jgi:motility quorum-sensing regulator / GCU-specific mRNA interferase toxin
MILILLYCIYEDARLRRKYECEDTCLYAKITPMYRRFLEKRKCHFSLDELKELFYHEDTRIITRLAARGGISLGYTDDTMIDVIDRLGKKHFYKSMTFEKKPYIWQDVYKVTDNDNDLYIKIQLSADGKKAVLVQFKRDESGDI